LNVVPFVLLALIATGCAAGGGAPHKSATPVTAVASHPPLARVAPEPPRDVGGGALPLLRDTPVEPATLVSASGLFVRGIDPTDGRMFATDSGTGVLRQSSDWGATWSVDKELPPGVARHVVKIVRFGDFLYLLATGPVPGVWRAAPTAGNAPFEWSSELLRLPSGTTGIMTDLNASSWPANNYLYVGTYGDPVGGPSIWRISASDANASGTAWERTYGPDASDRHIHAVAADPFAPGDVWATIGDGGQTTLAFSNTYGATWVPVIKDYAWQSVQISFDARYIYLAGDQPTFAYAVLDRATFTPLVAAPNTPADIPIPVAHAPADHYYAISYYGAVDPATGSYYCVANDTSATGTWMGMFFARRVGERLQVLDPGGVSRAMNGEVFIAHGTVYSGEWQHPVVAGA
jgi:hypothetical protein